MLALLPISNSSAFAISARLIVAQLMHTGLESKPNTVQNVNPHLPSHWGATTILFPATAP